MFLSPAPEVALRWLAATPRARHRAGKGPVSPASPGGSHQWVQEPGKGARCLLQEGAAKEQQCHDRSC